MEAPTPIISIIQNALIGLVGGFLSWIFDVSKGKHVSLTKAVTKVICGGFCANFFTPMIMYYRSLPYQFESFVSAILGILGYKIIEFVLSLEFIELIKTFIREKGKDMIDLFFKPKSGNQPDNTGTTIL